METNMEFNDIEFPPGVKDLSSDMNPGEMVKALKKCCKFFSQLEQDEEEIKQQFLPFCHYIVQDEFLKETKDENCRIHIGCILADVFRLHAPENPFRSGEKVQEIFMFLTNQLCHLKDSKGPLFPKAYHILENVATIKSYNICIDLDDANATSEIFCDLFKTIFSIINSGHDKQLKTHMLDIMGFAISDGGSVPQPLLDVILECLLEKTRKMNPSAYELARDLLRRTCNVVEQFLMLFFQNVLLANKQESSKLSSKWTKLIPELYKITPTLLLNTLPQLELKLRVDDPKERLEVVTLLSQMFSAKDSNLAIENSTLWNCFLGRFNDIDSEVRACCVLFCRDLIINHGRDSPFSKEIAAFFKPRRHDTEENVRVAVVSSIRGIALHDLQLASDELLEFLKERLLDKKWRVRESVIRAMADIYKKYTISENPSKMFVRRLSSFKSKLLHVYYRQNTDDCLLLERVLVSSLVPYTLPNKERMKHLLEVYVTVDDRAVKSFMEIIKKQRYLRAALKEILAALKLTDEEEQSKIILSKVMTIVPQLSGSVQHTRENINKFIQIIRQDAKIRQWMSYIVGEKYTCQKVAVAVRDLLKKLENDGATKGLKTTVQQLLERAVIVPVLVDQTSLILLFDFVKESLDGVSDVSELNTENGQQRSIGLLKNLSLLAPHLFSSAECFQELLGFLRRTRADDVVLQSLVILEHTGHVVEGEFSDIRSVLLPELKNKAKSGSPPQVKRAIYCLNKFTSVRETPLMQVFDYCKNVVTSEGVTSCDQLESILTALGCIAQVLPKEAAVQLRSVIASVVVKQVIMKTSSSSYSQKGKKKEMKWCEESELGRETRIKIAGMKCIVRWLNGLRSNESDCCGSTLRLLQHMLHNEGDLMKSGVIPKADMSHLRLQAAFCVLRIARVVEYTELFKPDIYQELTMLINDSVLEVRKNFLNKLYKCLYCFQIHISFLSLFAMVSQETLKEQREHGSFLYHQLIKRTRDFSKQNPFGSKFLSTKMPEYMLPFLIYLLATDPDFLEGISKRSLARIKDCIHFILDPLLAKDHPESFGFIKRLAENLKRSKITEKPNDVQRNENIYAVCDLVVQHVLQRSGQFAVALIEPADSSVVKFIPSRLFREPTGPENNKIYLPREFYANVKQVPTLPTTSSLRGSRVKRNQSSVNCQMREAKTKRKKPALHVFGGALKTFWERKAQPILKSPPISVRTAAHPTPNTSLSLSPSPRRPSPLNRSSIASSSTLPTPPVSSQTSGSQESQEATTAPVRTSGRKRKPRSFSPPLPMTSPKRKAKSSGKPADADGTDDEDSENEDNLPLALASKRTKTAVRKAEPAAKKSAPLSKKRNVIASASINTTQRKTLGVSNGQSKNEEAGTAVRRSNRRRK